MNLKIKTNEPIVASRDKITNTIATFWNKTSDAWRAIWGPHLHHGYYETNKKLSPLEAQEILIEKLAGMLNIQQYDKILDAGCGMGGSSIYLAKKYQAAITGITLSHRQAEIAAKQAEQENVKSVVFKIEDALSLASLENNSFDIVWSLESCEQFYDKELFFKQAFRVLKPGGKFMLATWCSDRDEYQDDLAEKYQKLCLAFDLPYMPSIQHYRSLFEKQNFKLAESADWAPQVGKSWDVGMSLLNAYSFLRLIKMAGWYSFRAASQIKLMQDGFRNETIRYGVFVATKP